MDAHLTGLNPPDNERLFRALSDPTRQRVLQLLIAEELNVTELVEILRQPQSTISRHLKVLRAAALIVDRREGVTSYYRAATAHAESSDLSSMLMNWFHERSMGKVLQERLNRVLRERTGAAGSFFERLGKRWDDLRISAFGDAFAMEAFLTLLPRNWTVADIGTGTGYLLPTLADNFQSVIAIDPAAAMLECARHRAADHGATNVTFHQGDLGRVPIDDNTCDLAIAFLVLHHVPQPAEALAEIHRVVRPGGHVLIVEQQSHENQKFYETMQDHWWGFDPADLARQTIASGFHSVRHRPLYSPRDQSRSIEAPSLFVLTGDKLQN